MLWIRMRGCSLNRVYREQTEREMSILVQQANTAVGYKQLSSRAIFISAIASKSGFQRQWRELDLGYLFQLVRRWCRRSAVRQLGSVRHPEDFRLHPYPPVIVQR
jgi:hypothetical protein